MSRYLAAEKTFQLLRSFSPLLETNPHLKMTVDVRVDGVLHKDINIAGLANIYLKTTAIDNITTYIVQDGSTADPRGFDIQNLIATTTSGNNRGLERSH